MSASCIYGTILSYYLSGTTFSEIFSIGIDEDAIQAASRQWEAKITEVYVRICSTEESSAQEGFKLVYHPFLPIHFSLKPAPIRRGFCVYQYLQASAFPMDNNKPTSSAEYEKATQVEQYNPYTIDYDEILPVNGFRLVR